ncbi:MAG: putative arabinose efflux permease, family [Massilia sp.]|jgi:MFS family permease|nr:putative arabinose efflux permease, family [Massilia sp.]MDB5953262.1 putative arabinose efflux permease, family [Massilia sp.]
MSSHSPSPIGPPHRGVAPFFLSSFAWNFTLGMTYILIPLYARSLGMAGLAIGMLVALPIMLQIGVTLTGGALTDRVGGKNMAMTACALSCIASMVFMASAGFALMFGAQLLMVMSRALFWPATWSLASQLPGSTSVQMGRLNGVTNAGQIAGTAAGGFIIAEAGFRFGFGVMAVIGFVALLFNQLYRHAGAIRRAPAEPVFATYRMLIGKRVMRYGILCAYISALPMSLSFSFYPILLVEQGIDSNTTGTLIALRGVGAVLAGFSAGYLMKQVSGIRVPFISAMLVGLSVVAAATVSSPALIGVFLFALGAGSAITTLYFQMLISLVSTKETRGSAMALGSMGWAISHLTTPLAMGVLNDYIGIHLAFYIMGGFALLCGFALVPLRRWAFGAEPMGTRDAV